MWCKSRHEFALWAVRVILWPYFFLRMGFRFRTHRLAKDRAWLVLANHQSFWDPLFVSFVYDRPIHFLATDNIFSRGFFSKLLCYFLAPIPKKKQGADLLAIRAALQVAREGGVVGIFPEGSCSYDGMPGSIDIGVAQLAKRMGADIALCRVEGGFGCDPRWSAAKRRGHLLCSNARIIPAAEAAGMSDEALLAAICEALAVQDAPSQHSYRSRRAAEHIESCVYICPRCGALCSIHSKGCGFSCSACGLTGRYTEHLALEFADPSVGITQLSEWLARQREFARGFVAEPGQTIFEDDAVRFWIYDRVSGTRTNLGRGRLRLTDEALCFCPTDGAVRALPIETLEILSPVSGVKLAVTTRQESYFLRGGQGFNPYKYTQIVNRLQMRDEREIK